MVDAQRMIHTGLDLAGHGIAMLARQRRLTVETSSVWTAEHTRVLSTLPGPLHSDGSVYQAICAEPTSEKRHVVVRDGDDVTALLSLRRRPMFWEPVACQVLPGFIAPARDRESLARALHACGFNIKVESGLEAPPLDLRPTESYGYPVRQVDLQSDFEAYWRSKGRKKSLKAAQKRCADFDLRIDEPGALDWVLDQWHDQWHDHDSGETVVAPDRAAGWGELARRSDPQAWAVHTLTLCDGHRRTAGIILLVLDGFVSFQCTARDQEYDHTYAGSRILELAIRWAHQQGFAVFDLGGGDGYKRWWGPVATQRHAAIFRPWPHQVAASAARNGSQLAKSAARHVRSERTG